VCRRSAGLHEYMGLLRFRARPITPAERHPPRKPHDAGVRMSMNETVYLFALSAPDMLEPLIGDRFEIVAETRPSESEERPS
jgi:hypothetical protein